MGIYVISKKNGGTGHYDDVFDCIFVEGVIILDNIGSVAQARSDTCTEPGLP